MTFVYGEINMIWIIKIWMQKEFQLFTTSVKSRLARLHETSSSSIYHNWQTFLLHLVTFGHCHVITGQMSPMTFALSHVSILVCQTLGSESRTISHTSLVVSLEFDIWKYREFCTCHPIYLGHYCRYRLLEDNVACITKCILDKIHCISLKFLTHLYGVFWLTTNLPETSLVSPTVSFHTHTYTTHHEAECETAIPLQCY